MIEFLRDLKFSLRLHLKSPGFTILLILVLALGIGANTCIFSVLNAVAWRNWPGARDPQRLVWLRTHRLFGSVSYPDYLDHAYPVVSARRYMLWLAIPVNAGSTNDTSGSAERGAGMGLRRPTKRPPSIPGRPLGCEL